MPYKDKIKQAEAQHDWYLAHKAEVLARAKAWKLAHREEIAAAKKRKRKEAKLPEAEKAQAAVPLPENEGKEDEL